MSDTHAPRPTDLVALVTFDDQVRENLAVTRERLGEPPQSPRPLSAAIEQWLHLGRQTWITVDGRQVQGIATARELSRSTWQVDALIDATEQGDERAGDVLAELLRQAALAARDGEVSLVVLRTPEGSPAVEASLRAGYQRAQHERLWAGVLAPATEPAAGGVLVREAEPDDAGSLFQLYSRATPLEVRSALAMTFDEWESTRERRWCARGTGLVALQDGRITGHLRLGHGQTRGQLELSVEREGREAQAAACALLDEAVRRLGDVRAVLALVPAGATVAESALAARGLSPLAEYVVLSRRIARPVREHARARAGIAIPSSG